MGLLQKSGESRRTIRRYFRLDVVQPTRQADADRLESRFLAGPQPEEQGVSFLLGSLRDHLELTIRADSLGETVTTTNCSLELNVYADFLRRQSNRHIVSGIACVEEEPSTRKAGFAVCTEDKRHISRLAAGGPAQNHPQCGSSSYEPAGCRIDAKPLGTAKLLGGQRVAESIDFRVTHIERRPPQLHLTGKNLYLAHSIDLTTTCPSSNQSCSPAQ